MLTESFTITIYTENSRGLLVRIAGIFLRRRLHIESLNVAASEIEGIHRFDIVLTASVEVIKRLVMQIDKQVDVFKTYFVANQETICRQQALYKIGSGQTHLDAVLHDTGMRCICSHPEYIVLEATGPAERNDTITAALAPFVINEMTRSGSIAIVTGMMPGCD